MATPMRRWDSTNRISNSPMVCDAGRTSVPSLSSDSSVISVNDLPQPFQSVFGFRYFNCLQSECFPVCFLSDVNMVISAPTGSGKTVLFELCILRILSRFIAADRRFYHSKGTLKTIYVAPSKALVQEKLRHWNEKFSSLGIICLELTSDNENYSIKNIQDADIILTTPEKFDAVSRFNMNGLSFFSDIALFLIDEVHLLNDPRGAALEAIVSRIKMVAKSPQMNMNPISHVRFVAVSATIPNLEDLAEWLIVPPQGMKRFGEEMRPVKLTTKVFGYAAAKNDFLFEKRLENYIFDILMQFSRGKSALVFCSTRKGAQEAAQKISQTAMKFGNSNPFIKSGEQQERLREASLSCSDRQMQAYILYGVGYHNGGLCMKDRNLIESLFLHGDIQVLCTTNTLAHGINLPAHTVVIKSTQHYNKEKNHYMEYDRSTVLQMCGRAGRPPFDDTGMVIIMTRKETVHLYENLLNGCETVESQLLSCMTEHLTAEIVQLTVPDITRAIEWMKCSFLYVRMKQKPENYGFEKGISKDRVERHMHEVCVQKVNELSKYQMIWTDEDGFVLNPLEPGKLMTKYYLKMDTMKHIMQTSPSCNLEDILQTVSRAEELSWIQLRRNEKKILNDINIDKDSRLRFHILGDRGKRKKRIQTREEKIFVLANDCLTGDPCAHDLALSQDANSIGSNGSRVAKCMREYFIYKKNYKGALNSSLLAKSLHQKLWDDSPFLLKQLPGIGMVTAKALHSMGVNSFQTLLEADPRRIEIITGRKYPFGNHIKESLNVLPPKVEMNVETAESHGRQMPKLAMKLSRLSESKSAKRHYADMFIGLQEDNLIVYHEKIRVEEFTSPYSTTITLPKLEHGKGTFKTHLIFEEYIGIDQYKLLKVSSEVNSDITPRKLVTRQLTLTKPIKTNEVENGSKLPSPPQVEKTPPRESKEKLDFMPSIDLRDKELDEALLAMTEEDDDECRIIDDHTVFDHIRKKAKIFPTVAAPVDTPSLSPESLKLGRKRLREMHSGTHSLADGSLDKDKSKEPDHEMVSSVSETEKVDHSSTMAREISPYKPRFISRSLDIVNLMEDAGTSKSTGSLLPTVTISEEPKESKTAFDHVRKKFKRPLMTLNSKPSQPDSSTSSKQPDQFDFSIIPDYTAKASRTSNNPQQNNTIVLLDSKPTQPQMGLSGHPDSSSLSKQPDDLDLFDFNIPEPAKASHTSNNDTKVVLNSKPSQPQKGLSGHPDSSSSSKQPDDLNQFDFSIIPEFTAKASRTSNDTKVVLNSKPSVAGLSIHPVSSLSSKQPDDHNQFDFSIIPEYTTKASHTSNNPPKDNTKLLLDSNSTQPQKVLSGHPVSSSSSKQPDAQQNNTTVLLDSKPSQQQKDLSATPKANERDDVNAPAVLPIIKKSPKSPACWTAAAIIDAWRGDQFTGESYLGFRSVFSFL